MIPFSSVYIHRFQISHATIPTTPNIPNILKNNPFIYLSKSANLGSIIEQWVVESGEDWCCFNLFLLFRSMMMGVSAHKYYIYIAQAQKIGDNR